MKWICRLLKQDPETREGVVVGTSGLGIAVNLLIASAKIILGLIASSIAIISEGVNNASDVLTSVITLIGTKLAGKHPDEKHPFGYGRVEYLTSLIISVLILVTGIEMLKSSVELIFHPAELSISTISLVVLAVSAAAKFLLGIYTEKMGKSVGSGSLIALGLDSKNDSYMSLVTIVSAIVFLIFHLSIDAYVGVFTSVIILKAGYEVLKDTVADLIGRPGEEELAKELYKEIRATNGVLNAADMMLHNYGPDAWSGSVNVEIDHSKTVGEMYQILHALQLRIMHEKKVTMVFGVYAVDNDKEKSRELRKYIGSYVQKTDHVNSFHAMYMDTDAHNLYVDLVVDYKLREWDSLRADFLKYMSEFDAELPIELTIETEYV